ncbi:hypothetical protein MHYP_G00209500 [Metynnis hypsauchen]
MKETLMTVVEKANLPLSKLTSIATDGAPSMTRSVNGLVGLCKSDDRFPEFWTFHCIIHQEQLVSEKLDLDHVMKPVLEIVNFIRTHALHHRQFRNLIADLDENLPSDLPLHCNVRWLSRGIKWLSGRSACPLGPSRPTRPAPHAGELPSQLPPLLRR